MRYSSTIRRTGGYGTSGYGLKDSAKSETISALKSKEQASRKRDAIRCKRVLE